MNTTFKIAFAAIMALSIPTVGSADSRLNPSQNMENGLNNPTQSVEHHHVFGSVGGEAQRDSAKAVTVKPTTREPVRCPVLRSSASKKDCVIYQHKQGFFKALVAKLFVQKAGKQPAITHHSSSRIKT